MAGVQELLEALRAARKSVAGPGEALSGSRSEALESAAGRLEALLAEGLPAMDEAQAAEVASELRCLLESSSLNLKWSRLRADLAAIGAPREAAPAAPVHRLDLVS